eukprot:s6399_g3.t2
MDPWRLMCISVRNLSLTLSSRGQLGDAAAAQAAALVAREASEGKYQLLGASHPEALEVRLYVDIEDIRAAGFAVPMGARRDLGATLFAASRKEEGVAAFRQALAGLQQTLGFQHPTTIAVLAQLRAALSHDEEAATALVHEHSSGNVTAAPDWEVPQWGGKLVLVLVAIAAEPGDKNGAILLVDHLRRVATEARAEALFALSPWVPTEVLLSGAEALEGDTDVVSLPLADAQKRSWIYYEQAKGSQRFGASSRPKSLADTLQFAMPSSSGTIPGDTDQRVSVALPRSLHELKGHANKHFGVRAQKPLRMYHHGKVVITHAQHVTNLKDGDVVVVTVTDEEQGPPPISTHQAHYVPHRLEAKKPPPAQDGPGEGVPFDGKSSYTVDYIPHPLEVRDKAKPPRNVWEPGRTDAKTGKSTYNSEFPWHTVKPPESTKKQVPPAGHVPFDGVTSYQHDYIKHPNRPRSATGRPKPQLPASGPFDGSTTYTTDYKRFHVPQARPLKPHDGVLKTDKNPFEGASEYRREYLKHPLQGPEILHIEPDLRRGDVWPKRPATEAGSRRH